MDSAAVRVEAVVRGRVQGVGYRYFVLREAISLGVDGWVANEQDGSVRCVAEGDRTAVHALLAEVRRGPRGARVESVGETWLPATGAFDGFTVRTGWHDGD